MVSDVSGDTVSCQVPKLLNWIILLRAFTFAFSSFSSFVATCQKLWYIMGYWPLNKHVPFPNLALRPQIIGTYPSPMVILNSPVLKVVTQGSTNAFILAYILEYAPKNLSDSCVHTLCFWLGFLLQITSDSLPMGNHISATRINLVMIQIRHIWKYISWLSFRKYIFKKFHI